MDLALLQMKLQDLLNGKRYFIVLYEYQEKWANLRQVLKIGATGASIRLEKVGSIMETLQPYNCQICQENDCWLLFMQRAFGHQKEINPNLVTIGKFNK